MKLTKYPQSCFMIEAEGKRILIDPGNIGNMKPEEFGEVDIVLITHRHLDHCYPILLKGVQARNPDAKFYCNSEVRNILLKEGIKCNVVKVGETIDEDNITIEVVRAVHGYATNMANTGFPDENNGYLIQAEGKSIYHTSDTIGFWTVIKPDILLLPVCGHGIVFEPRSAVEWAEMLQAKIVIPMHYESPMHPLGAKRFEEEMQARKTGMKYKVMENGETVGITE